jgi:predicted phosphoribosyltransferase
VTNANVKEQPELRNRKYVFADRDDAGVVLAEMLREYAGGDAIVLGIPAGGVPVATVLAGRLSLPVDVVLVSKITLPHNTESGYGAVALDGTVRINAALVRGVGLSQSQVETGLNHTKLKIRRRADLFYSNGLPPTLAGRAVIVVDDGLASGITMRVAVEAVRHEGTDRVVVAVPTGHAASVAEVAHEADEVYCANIREGLSFAVAQAYDNWYDVSEEEALELLRRARTNDDVG